MVFRCFESGIYRGFFRKNWELLFNKLVVIHNVSETVIINIYNDWGILASEKHPLTELAFTFPKSTIETK